MSGAPSLERRLAAVLFYGSWLASAVIAVGTSLTMAARQDGIGSAGFRITKLGIACLILLPVVRVIFMLDGFLRAKDYRLATAATLVLLILMTAFLIGALTMVQAA